MRVFLCITKEYINLNLVELKNPLMIIMMLIIIVRVGEIIAKLRTCLNFCKNFLILDDT
jgi:hypothetical protein